MFDEYRKEMREQGKSIRGLARYMGKSESSLTKKFTGVNPLLKQQQFILFWRL